MGKNNETGAYFGLPQLIGLGIAAGLLVFTVFYAYDYVTGWESESLL